LSFDKIERLDYTPKTNNNEVSKRYDRVDEGYDSQG